MAKYRGVARDEFGNTLSGASVTVYDPDGTTESTIYSDSELATAMENPITVGDDGTFLFYILPGYYDIQVAKSGYTTQTLVDEAIGGITGHLIGDTQVNDDVALTATVIDNDFGFADFWSDGYLGGFENTNGVLTYVGTPTIQVRVSLSLAVQQGVADRVLNVGLYKNWDVAGQAEIAAVAKELLNGAEDTLAFAGGVDLDTDDTITVIASMQSTLTAVAFITGDLFCQALDY